MTFFNESFDETMKNLRAIDSFYMDVHYDSTLFWQNLLCIFIKDQTVMEKMEETLKMNILRHVRQCPLRTTLYYWSLVASKNRK